VLLEADGPRESFPRTHTAPEYISLRPDITARDALCEIRKNARGKETVNLVYVVDKRRQAPRWVETLVPGAAWGATL